MIYGVEEIKGNKKMSHGAYLTILKVQTTPTQNGVNLIYQLELNLSTLDPRIKFNDKRAEPIEELDKVRVSLDYLQKSTRSNMNYNNQSNLLL